MVVQRTNPLLQVLGVLAVSNGLQGDTGERWVRGSDEATPSPGHINSGRKEGTGLGYRIRKYMHISTFCATHPSRTCTTTRCDGCMKTPWPECMCVCAVC